MDRTYWEKIAPAYNEEIFDVLKNDDKGLIVSAIKKYASKNKTVVDIGCAIGKWLPVLSPAFKKVYAIDISAENLEIAKKLYPELTNVEYDRVDMSNARAKMPLCDVGVCINAILTDSLKKRNSFFMNLKNCIKKNGYLILVIPSLESSMLASIIRQRWNPDKDADDVINKKKSGVQLKNILQGNAEIDYVPTKHYLKEELQLLLGREGFSPEDFQKIEYHWDTEFLKPPKWLKEPKPWDWMVIARKF
ncbi:MAG TPA: methyltransferase domain-containing protein [Chitinophagaceae bacterium]|nr:methyltransferase domain-containing protein [Chitinophagaceae bacterium]